MMEVARECALAILEEDFGPLVAKVAKVLFKCSCTMQTLVRLTELSPEQVRKSLLVLRQHHLLSYTETRRIFYTINTQTALLRNRFPAMCHIVNEQYGDMEQLVLETVLLHGTISTCFDFTASPCRECLRIIASSLGEEAAAVAKVLMFSNLHQELGNDRDVPVALAHITVHRQLPSGSGLTPDLTEKWLKLLVAEGSGMFHAGRSGLYYFDLKTAMHLVASLQLERILADRYGQESLRLIRLLLENHYLDQDQIVRMAMVERYAATRVLLNELFQAGLISCQEIPKSADRAPSRCHYLWHADHASVVKTLQAQLLHAITTAHFLLWQ
ncbi:hypothetical protein PTSG_03049 [Salpingoeca rosetta]|uniref:DNA-directed RNA polymerase III subunit RPC3 n=1 Tax=Salpingoeca rosetta (strain ATCC 50818 / BSB-021) TaxID=946362 RepID=F2U440_SALR5|nr:uncharacterized protein PTSG_03049 [Salpingoeca rosetta]EGD82406.1 hypothetical protein PTSG_03049 [Salpingoeca rosetta]|eukprot:XP_004995642.1 hypothetical protein PTSG_03049 [Salpingoeca rosetta]